MPLSRNIQDQELLQQLQQAGGEEAFTTLYHQYSGQIYLNVLKMVKNQDIAEELVQDLFATFWQKRASLQIEQSLAGYLYRMAANKVYDFYRKMQADHTMLSHFKALATEHYSHIEEALQYRESEALLQKALESLSPQQQKVYQLCKTEGYSYKEAAELMGISPYTVKEYLVKANQSLRNYLNNNIDTALSLLFLVIFKK